MRWRTLVLLWLWPIALPVQAALPLALTPYLQHPTADGMTICFVAQGAEQVRVAWALGDQPLTEAAAKPWPLAGTPWTHWRTRLTGLPAGAAARYQMRYRLAGADVETPLYSFRTLDPQAAGTRFVVLNDLHNRDQTLAALLRWVKPEEYDFSILLGDCIPDPKVAKGAELVMQDLEAYGRLLDAARKPLLMVRGNHETRGNFGPQLARLFDLPLLDPAAKWGDDQWQFTLRTGPVWFALLDTGEDDDLKTPESSYKAPRLWQAVRRREAAWLKETLAARPWGDSAWRVFASHIPLFGPEHSVTAQEYWAPLLPAAGFDLLLAGHTHSWQVLKPGADGQPVAPQVVGGGPSLPEATIGVYQATRDRLSARLLAADGRQLAELALNKTR